MNILIAGETTGSRLRELRRQHGLSLRALAEKSGLSANTLSLVENGKTSPSISTLQQIAIALNCPINAFFERIVNREPVVYTIHDQRQIQKFSNLKLEDLSDGSGDEGLLPILVSFDPHCESGSQPLVKEGSEFIFCLMGQVIYTINGTAYTLEPGDSLFFPATTPYTWANRTGETCKVIIVTFPSAV